MKKCTNCGEENPNDFKACKNCGKTLLSSFFAELKKEKITILLLLFVFSFWGIKLYDKITYKSANLIDNHTNIEVAKYKIPSKWISFGRVFYNPTSIPNLLTFCISAANPKENVDIRFFSTQYETSDNLINSDKDYKDTDTTEKYLTNIVKRLAPSAEYIKLEKKINPSSYEITFAKEKQDFFKTMYENINPGTTKGLSWLENLSATPVHYVFSYYEKGEKYYHILECLFVSFSQYFLNEPEAKLTAVVKYTKCEDFFSYRAPEKYFAKNKGKYNTFKNNFNINPEWIDYSYAERRKLLASANYLTTETLVAGGTFDTEAFKNLVYIIEYLDKASIETIRNMY